MRHEAIRLGKKQKRLQEHELTILNRLISEDAEDGALEILDTIADKSNTFTVGEEIVFLQEALSLLTPRQQKVITATILEGRTEQEVAKQLGISQPVVHRMKQRALNRLRKHIVLDEPTDK